MLQPSNICAKLIGSLCFFFIVQNLLAQPQGRNAGEPAGLDHSLSIGATSLWPDSSEFSLTGDGYVIHQWEGWDGGYHPDATLPSLNGRVFYADSFMGISGHATDMANIMVGNSTDSGLSGIAYEAAIRAYSNADPWQEVITEAAGGMKLSAHIYASNFGWNQPNSTNALWLGLEEVDSTEDYNFGLYNSGAAGWDSIVSQNPYSFMVLPAGNWRGEAHSGPHRFYKALVDSITSGSNYVKDTSSAWRSPDGGADGYDCLPPESVAKNVLTVGAADVLVSGWHDTSDVVPADGSAFGPADDGRIKPDVVTGGDKTSHSVAAAAGVSVLLQEHFVNTYGHFPLSATLKALLIHTADEAGANPGPDYQCGWGLINALKAARHISDTTRLAHIYEDTLANGETLLYHFYAEADELKATLCWTDPEGTPVPFQNSPIMLDNPTPMLVNDMDIRLVRRRDGDTSLPYLLNPAAPANAASTGDNTVDNVEQIDLDNLEEGWYTLVLSNKGNLQNGMQLFSLMVSGGSPGLVWDGLTWTPRPPDAHSQDYDVLIMEGTEAEIPSGARVRNLTLERNSRATIR